jgi:hypothetical protein
LPILNWLSDPNPNNQNLNQLPPRLCGQQTQQILLSTDRQGLLFEPIPREIGQFKQEEEVVTCLKRNFEFFVVGR